MRRDDAGRVQLTQREREVLTLLVQEGLTTKEIAHRLEIAPSSVAAHRQRMNLSLGICGSKLIAYANRHRELLEGEWVERAA